MAKISVVINTYNAEQHLERVLQAVAGFDEVVICDMESTDSTLDIARAHGCRIVTFERGEHRIVEPARQFAIEQAAHPWVLVVDADELVTPALREHLYAFAARAEAVTAFSHEGDETVAPLGLFIPRKNYFMGRFMHCHYPDYILRFFRKDVVTWPPYVHAIPQIDGPTVRLPRHQKELAFEHLANDGVSDILRKTNQYTDSELMKKRGKRYGLLAFLWRPFFRWFKAYVLKGGFRDGLPGLIRACLEGHYQFIMLAKMAEERRA